MLEISNKTKVLALIGEKNLHELAAVCKEMGISEEKQNVLQIGERFADMMNQKARDIGCSNTYFVTPNGLDGTDKTTGMYHSTTAEELAQIMRYCIKQSPKSEMFLEITKSPSHTFSDLERTRTFSCINHNALLTTMEGALSGKTGFTNRAGYCYIGAVEKDGKLFIAALLA